MDDERVNCTLDEKQNKVAQLKAKRSNVLMKRKDFLYTTLNIKIQTNSKI